MSYILTDLADADRVLEASEAVWQPVAVLILEAGILNLSQQAEMEETGSVEITERQARLLAQYLREEVLPTLGERSWLGLDGVVHTEPDDFALQRALAGRSPGVGAEFLEKLAGFCAACGGFFVS
jgi:hypothetical protein